MPEKPVTARPTSNRSVGLFKAKVLGTTEKIGHTANPVSGGPFYLAFFKQAGAAELTARFSTELRRFKKTPVYREILNRYGQ